MKRFTFAKVFTVLVICIFTAVCNPSFVFGDVIWEPKDSFYEKMREDCHYEDRTYLANGEKGYVTVYKNPKSSRVVTDIENGKDIYILFTYEDKSGQKWGLTEFYDDSQKNGWVLMGELIALYDHLSFCNDHEKEFVDYDGSFNPDELEDIVYVWNYPGSDVITSKLYKDELQKYLPSFSYMYKDDGERQWAYFGYYMGREGWICLTDPENESLPAVKVDYEGLIPASKPERSLATRNELLLFLILVGGVVIVTAILIKVFYGKKKA